MNVNPTGSIGAVNSTVSADSYSGFLNSLTSTLFEQLDVVGKSGNSLVAELQDSQQKQIAAQGKVGDLTGVISGMDSKDNKEKPIPAGVCDYCTENNIVFPNNKTVDQWLANIGKKSTDQLDQGQLTQMKTAIQSYADTCNNNASAMSQKIQTYMNNGNNITNMITTITKAIYDMVQGITRNLS